MKKKRGFWGLVLLTASILIPLARGDIAFQELGRVFISWVGLLAFAFSMFTTYIGGQGLQCLTVQGHADVMPALILGIVVAASFLGGVPLGPLITSGLLALCIKLLSRG